MENTIQELTLLSDEAEYCDITKISTLITNLSKIDDCMDLMGYLIGYNTISLNETSLPIEIKPRFTAIEDYLYRHASTVDYRTSHMLDEQYEWDDTPIDIRTEINRWFAWNNEQKEICDEVDEGCQPLCDDYRELTRDINDSIIFVEVE